MTTPTPSGPDIIRQWLATSPFVGYLSIELAAMEPGMATLKLPYDNTVTTIGTVIHGGAIATLIDTAAAVAAWSDIDAPTNVRGATVSLSISYLAAADNEDVQATARVLRRGSSLVYLDVDVRTTSGRPVARGLATYKIG